MKILDRYVFGNFVRQLVLWYITLVGIYFILDLFQNLGGYFDYPNGINPFLLMFKHYFFISFAFIDVVLALLIVMAALASTSMMMRRNEVIALVAMGVSQMRIMLPILAGAALFSFLATFVREIYVPWHASEYTKTIEELAMPDQGVAVKQASDAVTKVKFTGGTVYRDRGEIQQPVISLSARYFETWGSEIVAASATFCAATQDRPAGYLLRTVSKPDNIAELPSITRRNTTQKVILTPRDFPDRLKPDECFVISGLHLEYLEMGEQWSQFASCYQMIQGYNNPHLDLNKQDLAARIHARLLRPLTDLLPLLLGLPVIFFRSDRNVFKSLAIGSLFAGLYIGIQYACVYFGTQFEMPVLAAWAPLFLFLPILTNVYADFIFSQ
ncbi:MAG: LptF/LptG family permease [Planctomycetia bacterium]|nr:LptF/LptG family permease [Planctomycetia bacterium]